MLTIKSGARFRFSLFYAAFFFISLHLPVAGHGATYQDVQNYLNANPAPDGCTNETEEIAVNNLTRVVKVWRKCINTNLKGIIYGSDGTITHDGSSYGRTIHTCDGGQVPGGTMWVDTFPGGQYYLSSEHAHKPPITQHLKP